MQSPFQSLCSPPGLTVYSPDTISPLTSIPVDMYPPPPRPLPWVTVYSQDIVSRLPIHSNLYIYIHSWVLFILKTLYHHYPSIPVHMYTLLGKCLFSRHYNTSTTPFQSIRTPFWVSVILKIISSLPQTPPPPPPTTTPRSNLFVPLLGKCLFLTLYLPNPPFKSPCTPSWVNVYSPDINHLYSPFISPCTPSFVSV